MAIRHMGQSQEMTNFLETANNTFAVLFTLEAAIKLLAVDLHYFTDPWNRFDFVVVILTDVGLLLELIVDVQVGGIATVVRAVRIARTIRLFHKLRGLRTLATSLLMTLPALANIGMLLGRQW